MPFDGEAAGKHSFDIAVKNRRTLAESKNDDCRRRRAADARQAGKRRRIIRKASTILGDQHLRAALQMAGTRVIAKAGPQGENFVERRRRQTRKVGKMRQKAEVIRPHAVYLRLLQHDFRQPDAVGVACILPRQVVATGTTLPIDHPLGKTVAGSTRSVIILLAVARRRQCVQIDDRAGKQGECGGATRLDSACRQRDNPSSESWRIRRERATESHADRCRKDESTATRRRIRLISTSMMGQDFHTDRTRNLSMSAIPGRSG